MSTLYLDPAHRQRTGSDRRDREDQEVQSNVQTPSLCRFPFREAGRNANDECRILPIAICWIPHLIGYMCMNSRAMAMASRMKPIDNFSLVVIAIKGTKLLNGVRSASMPATPIFRRSLVWTIESGASCASRSRGFAI